MELLTVLAEKGILGVLLAIMLYAYWKTQNKLSDVEAQRTEDAQKVVEVLLSQSEKNNATLGQLSSVIESQGGAIRAIEQEVKLTAALARGR